MLIEFINNEGKTIVLDGAMTIQECVEARLEFALVPRDHVFLNPRIWFRHDPNAGKGKREASAETPGLEKD